MLRGLRAVMARADAGPGRVGQQPCHGYRHPQGTGNNSLLAGGDHTSASPRVVPRVPGSAWLTREHGRTTLVAPLVGRGIQAREAATDVRATEPQDFHLR